MLHIITGPSCSGKSTFARENSKQGDIIIDFDAIAQALGCQEAHGADGAIKSATFAARQAAIDNAIEQKSEAWVIHTRPTEEQIKAYEEAGAEFIDMDTDMETCLRRCAEDGRPEGTEQRIIEWFENRKGGDVETKRMLEVQIKSSGIASDEEHYIIAYAATFHREPDSYGDVIAQGAFTNSIKAWQEGTKMVPLLFGHRMDDPLLNIGKVVEMEQDEVGLRVKALFDMENERGAYTWKLVKEGRLNKLSFAYDVRDWAPVELEDGTKANELRDLDIYEVSLVPVPANRHAEVIEVKDADVETKVLEDDAVLEDGEQEHDEAAVKDEEPDEAKSEEPSNIEAKKLAALIAIKQLEWSEK